MFMKRLAITLIFVLGFALLATPSFAQQENFLNVHTNEQVAIPGHVLPPGDYVFRLMESDQDPHIVEVMSADGSSLYGLFQVVPAQRPEFANGSSVTLTAPDAAGLQGISQWYFPGSSDGYQFVYSRKDIQKEDQIARRLTNQTDSGLQ
jgi:hypothetical protein